MVADCSDPHVLRKALSALAVRMPEYSRQLVEAGFECCHINARWIERHCSPEDLAIHLRYLSEYAAEVLAADEPFAVLRDTFVCRSAWLNELKAKRLATFGSFEDLSKRSDTRHLIELSPGWREFMRVRESLTKADKLQVEGQMADFVRRRGIELRVHHEAIARCCYELPRPVDARALQNYFSTCLLKEFENFGAKSVLTLRRNQALQRDEETTAIVFAFGGAWQFVLLPVVLASTALDQGITGTLSVGFRLMTWEALTAQKFEFGRDVVLLLQELLPNRFNDYGRFGTSEDFCLNVLAWTTALRLLLPELLEVLQVESRRCVS